MDLTKLQLGDWVMRKSDLNNTGRSYPVKVTGFECTDENATKFNVRTSNIDCTYFNMLFHENDIEPIEITNGFWLKNDFTSATPAYTPKKTINSYFYDLNNGWVISVWSNWSKTNNKWLVTLDNDDEIEVIKVELTYVHELQHFFKQYNINKEIIL